jgi:streptogramin lyase
MIDLLKRADPANKAEVDMLALRAKVDERVGLSVSLQRLRSPARRPWVMAAASFALVIAVAAIVAALRDQPQLVLAPTVGNLGNLPGIEEVVPLASGGVQTMAVDGDNIWVMTALAEVLQRISAATGQVDETYTIDGYVEGVIVGGGYVWLRSYDNGGEVLRFDPNRGEVDLRIAVGPPGTGAAWFNDSLWVGNDQSDLIQISQEGEIVSTGTGEIKGVGLGYLWVNDPETGLISSLAADGTRGEIVIPTYPGLETMSGGGVRQLTEADGRLWLMDDDYPWGTNLSVFDPNTGELRSFGAITFGLLDMTEFEGSLWLTSGTDHLVIRIDPESGEVRRYPMPGKAGGLAVADGSLWVTLYQPGSLVRLDPDAGLIESAPIVADDWDRFPHRLLCTGKDQSGSPTVILEPFDWIDYGSWSVVQAQLSNQGYQVCTNGSVEGESTPAQRAADLSEALTEAGISGPFVLVATGDGVHATRLFADGRSDIVGVVLVDPMPIGFQTLLDRDTGGAGHPAWPDLEPSESASLDDFGDGPLIVIGQDPQYVFLNHRFVETFGSEAAQRLNQYWQEGLAFYAGLSTNSRSVTATGTGMDRVIWDQPDLIVEEVTSVLNQVGSG